jgi:hypothetical protein
MESPIYKRGCMIKVPPKPLMKALVLLPLSQLLWLMDRKFLFVDILGPSALVVTFTFMR